MPISEKKYQTLFEEAQADAIRFRKERDAALGTIRVIGRVSSESTVLDVCKAAIMGTKIPNDDTVRIDAVIEGCAEIELTCGGVWRVSAYQDYEDPDLRIAIDRLIAATPGFLG